MVVVSRNAPRQYSWPAVAGFSPPSAPAPTICRSPFSSGFGAVTELGLGTYAKCVPAVVATAPPTVIVGAAGLE